MDNLRLHIESPASSTQANRKPIGLEYVAGRSRFNVQQHNVCAASSCPVQSNIMSALNGQCMLLSVYSPNIRTYYCTMISAVQLELLDSVQASNCTMIIELQFSRSVNVIFSVELCYNGHRVEVDHHNNYTLLFEAMAEFPDDLSHNVHRFANIYDCAGT